MRNYLVFILAVFVVLLPLNDSKAAKRCLNVRIIVPFYVGTATDLIFRAYTEIINRQSSGPLMKVLNKTHDTVIEGNMARSPDGCQFLAATQSLVAQFIMNKSSPKWSSFTPVSMLARTPLAVVARGNMKNPNLPNLIEGALDKREAIRVGETENALENLFRMQLEDVSGAPFKVTRFENARKNFVALLRNEVDLGIISISAAKRRADLKQIRILALTDTLENSKLSEVASLREQGIDTAFGVDRILLAPQNMSSEIVVKISKRFKNASEDPELQDRLAKINTKLTYLDPDELTQYFENLTADWSAMIARMRKRGRLKKPA